MEVKTIGHVGTKGLKMYEIVQDCMEGQIMGNSQRTWIANVKDVALKKGSIFRPTCWAVSHKSEASSGVKSRNL